MKDEGGDAAATPSTSSLGKHGIIPLVIANTNNDKPQPTRTGFMERKGKLEEMDRSFDLKFWQAQDDTARFAAAWELVVQAWLIKGRDVRELRLQRSVENFQRFPG